MLKLIVILILSTFASAQIDGFVRQIACENTMFRINCPDDSIIIIQRAVYGRNAPGSEICPHSSIATTKCGALNSIEKVQAACDGKQSCSISSSNSVFGDPCSGTYKYLEVDYMCLSTIVTTAEPETTTAEPETTTEEPETTTEEPETTTEEPETTTEEPETTTEEPETTTEEPETTTEEPETTTEEPETTTEEPETTTEELTTESTMEATKTKPTTTVSQTKSLPYSYKITVIAEKTFLNDPISLRDTYTVYLKTKNSKNVGGVIGFRNSDRDATYSGKDHVFLLNSDVSDITSFELNDSDDMLFKSWKTGDIKLLNKITSIEYACKRASIARTFTCTAKAVATSSKEKVSSKEKI